jgi:hypothetical protein
MVTNKLPRKKISGESSVHMGRMPNNELAICPVCKYDFTSKFTFDILVHIDGLNTCDL